MIQEYDFETLVERHDTASCKWDSDRRRGLVPMWVADMDFKTAPEIIEALHERADHGVFGYTILTDEYYEALINWNRRRHEWEIDREWVIGVTAIVPGLSAILRALTVPGEKVVVQTPVYNCFFDVIADNGLKVVHNPLKYHDLTYTMDYEDLEIKCADPAVKVMILCNPANPVGRVWTPDELKRVGDICLKHGVTIIADEIHCELVYEGHHYTPFASLGEKYRDISITCVSPSKAFNLAGLHVANLIIPDNALRERVNRAVTINRVGEMNPFGVSGLIAAYNCGETWLMAVNEYIYDNYRFMVEFCEEFIPQVKICRLEGTYLAWMDCSALDIDSARLGQLLLDEQALWVNAGTMYGPDGNGFMRWNIACSRVVLTEGLNRLASFIRRHH